MEQSPAITQLSFRERLRVIIFEHDTAAGRAFDVALLIGILASTFAVMLESVGDLRASYGLLFTYVEWTLTGLFTVEYFLRLATARKLRTYSLSFLGIIDLMAIAPSYVSLFIPGSQALLTIRALRLLRVFRILKAVEYVKEASELGEALRASSRKIIVFLGTVLTLTVIMGSTMYLIEGAEHGFTSIPKSVYWAIVTMTTVGYGDIAPETVPGQFVAALVMILGYAIIAVPTGIVSAEFVQARRMAAVGHCHSCREDGHDTDAAFCKYCGVRL